MTTNGKLNPKEVRDDKYEEKAQLKAIEEKIYQTMEVSPLFTQATEFKLRIEELKEKLVKIKDEKQEERETYLIASRKLEKDLNKKISEHEGLAAKLELTKKDYEEKLRVLSIQKDDEIKILKAEVTNVKFELGKKISELNEELRNLKEFKDKQDEYFDQVDQIKKKHSELIHTHNDDLKRLDNHNSKAIQMQQDKHQREINQIVHDAKKGAEQEVEKLDKKVIEDNKKLNLDLLHYKKEVELLKKEKERAIGENKHIKQNMSLQEDSVLEYQAIHFRQESKIKKLKEKVRLLKAYITQQVNGHTKELEACKYQSQIKINELETICHKITDKVQIKLKESKAIKALSQVILDQRSEIEEFLLDTLTHVKEEVKKQRSIDKKLRLPEIIGASKGETKNRIWDRVDFSSLDWEDKEKILRILFAKMNSGVPPSHWRSNSLRKSMLSNSPGKSLLINTSNHVLNTHHH